MKYCSKCGNELMDEAVICPKCGCPVENAEKPKKKKGLKIALIVFSVLIVIYLIGFFFGDKTSSNTNDEVAYTCTQDVIENLMELTNNPHSMKVYTVKYDFAGENPAEMVLCLYIEYKLVDSEGNGREEHGFVTYNVNMDERTFAMDDSCALSFSSAALGGLFGSGAKLSLGHIPCGIHYTDDTSGWVTLDVNTIKETAGLEQQYTDVQWERWETWKAFLRRIGKVVEYKADGSIVTHKKEA